MKALVSGGVYIGNGRITFGQKADEEGAIAQNVLMVSNYDVSGDVLSGGGTTSCVIDDLATEYPFEVNDMVSVYWPTTGNGTAYSSVIHGYVSARASYNITVGSYSGNFPANTTPVAVVQQTEIAAEFDGDNLAAIAASCSEAASLNFVDGTTLQLATVTLTAGVPWFWIEDTGYTNPLASKTVDKIGFVQLFPTGTELCKLALLHDNVT